MKKLLGLVFALTAACGGPSEPPTTPSTTEAPPTGETAHQHETTSPELAKINDALQPHFHAASGTERTAAVCAMVPQLATDTQAVLDAPSPAGTEATTLWQDNGQELASAVTALTAACDSNDAAAFETAFQKTHDAVHHLIDITHIE